MTDLGAENIVPRILTSDALSEVSQYEFDRDKMMVYLQNVIPLKNKNEGNVISRLKYIVKPLKIRLSLIHYIR